MSSGKLPEYTLLTPLPLTPDVISHDFEQLANMGLAMPMHDLLPHYSYVNMVAPLGPSVIFENGSPEPMTRNLTSPEVDDPNEEEDERPGIVSSSCSSVVGNNGDDSDSGDGKIAKDPFAPQCKIPLPTPFSPYEYWLEPSFIRRRNERERQRVRNVNDGFERLKNHLPISTKDKDKRLSKVEILRMAIKYIQNLQEMLRNDRLDDAKENMLCCSSESD